MTLADLTPGMPVTWLDIPRGGYGFAMPVDAVVKTVCKKRVRIEVLLNDGRRVERVVTVEALRPARPDQTVAVLFDRIRTTLGTFAFIASNEKSLQEQVARILADQQELELVEREVRAARGQYDILVRALGVQVVLELKMEGSAAAVERQAQRYALTDGDERVDGVAVVTTSQRLASQIKPGQLGGKPFAVIALRTSF